MTLSLFLKILFGSTPPITGMKITIPLFLTTHPELPLWFILSAALIGYILPAFLLLWILPRLTDWLHRHVGGKASEWINWLYKKTHAKHSESFYRWGSIALIILIAIPFPGSGVWTASLVAFLFNIPYWRAIGVITIGAVIEAVLIAALSKGVLAGVNLL
jgi:uncharacterized membrane protein